MNYAIETALNIKKRKINEKLQYATIGVMLIALFARNSLGISIPVLALLGLMIIPVFFGSDDNIWATAATCIPFSTGFQYKYVLFTCLIVYVFRKRAKIRIGRIAVCVFLMMIWEYLHIFMGQFSLYEYLRCFAELLILVIIAGSDMNCINYKLVFRALALSTVGVCFIMLYIQLSRVDFNLASLFGTSYHDYRFGAGNTDAMNFGLNFNANGLGYICSLTLASMLVLYGRKEHTWCDVTLAILATIFGLLTLSRTYITCLVFVLFGFAVGTSGSMSKKVKNIFCLSCLALIIFLALYVYLPGVYNNLVLRFREEDLLNGRDYLLMFYFEHIFSSLTYLFFGIGLQDFQGKLIEIHGQYVQVCHNGLQEVWVAWGIVGVILFIGMLFAMLTDSKCFSGKRPLNQYVPMVLMLLYTSAGQLIRSELALLSLIVIYICISLPKIKER